MSEELKPCPFCGSLPSSAAHDCDDWNRQWIVACEDPNCGVQPYFYESDKPIAEAAWNRRAQPTAAVVRVTEEMVKAALIAADKANLGDVPYAPTVEYQIALRWVRMRNAITAALASGGKVVES